MQSWKEKMIEYFAKDDRGLVRVLLEERSSIELLELLNQWFTNKTHRHEHEFLNNSNEETALLLSLFPHHLRYALVQVARPHILPEQVPVAIRYVSVHLSALLCGK